MQLPNIVAVDEVQASFLLHNTAKNGASLKTQKELVKEARTNHGLRFAKFFGRFDRFSPRDLIKNVTATERKSRKQNNKWIPTDSGLSLHTHPILDWLNPDALDQPNIAAHRVGHAKAELVVGDQILIEEALHRNAAMCSHFAGETFELQAVSRILSGIGLPHPSGNGFDFDHLLGVPVLRGSALKTITREGAEDLSEDPDEILGKENGAGKVSILDALPITRVRLCAEQITRHYRGYYDGPNPLDMQVRNDNEIPATWYEPVPSTRLALDASWESPQQFCFVILPGHRGTATDVKTASKWLKHGLIEFGYGARTTTFGHFVEIPTPE